MNEKLKQAIQESEAIVLGAGAGLSSAAGYLYEGDRFDTYFSDFSKKYGFEDMYSGGFYPYERDEIKWAFWSRYIYINRFMPIPSSLYEDIFDLVKDKDYFVITTNVDHCFQRAGFDKKRLFYTQGDYGLFQCSEPCHQKNYDNEALIKKMLLAQGFEFADDGTLVIPEGKEIKMEIPSYLLPKCPVCNKPMRMNLREDHHFVEDEGWDRANEQYAAFLERIKNKKVLFIEMGVGSNTPGIIKYPFWRMVHQWPDAAYACLNAGQVAVPEEIKAKSILIDQDIKKTIEQIKK